MITSSSWANKSADQTAVIRAETHSSSWKKKTLLDEIQVGSKSSQEEKQLLLFALICHSLGKMRSINRRLACDDLNEKSQNGGWVGRLFWVQRA